MISKEKNNTVLNIYKIDFIFLFIQGKETLSVDFIVPAVRGFLRKVQQHLLPPNITNIRQSIDRPHKTTAALLLTSNIWSHCLVLAALAPYVWVSFQSIFTDAYK